jgi:hypothetical protein
MKDGSPALIVYHRQQGCLLDRHDPSRDCAQAHAPASEPPLRSNRVAVVCDCVLSAHDTATVLVSREIYLMGTRAHLSAYAPTRDAGLAKLESAVAILEETEEELSTWRESSDISALNRQPVGEPWNATPRLCRMFSDVWEWQRATGGAFDLPLDGSSPHGTSMGKDPPPAKRTLGLSRHPEWRSLPSSRGDAP